MNKMVKSASINQLYTESSMMVNELAPYQLKFYADSKDYQNKLFTFRIGNFIDAGRLLYRFERKGNTFRAVFLVYSNTQTGELMSFISSSDALKFFFFNDCEKRKQHP